MRADSTDQVVEAGGRSKKSFTRYLPAVARILMGLPLIVFGLNGFLNFIPAPATPLPKEAEAFATALMQSGYMMGLIGATQLIVGVLLVANRFVPLALALFAPFMVNSIAFHVFLEHTGLPMAAIFLALELYLVWVYRRAYDSMLVMRAFPTRIRARDATAPLIGHAIIAKLWIPLAHALQIARTHARGLVFHTAWRAGQIMC